MDRNASRCRRTLSFLNQKNIAFHCFHAQAGDLVVIYTMGDGKTVADQRLRIAGSNGEWLVWAKLSELKEAWQKPLRM